MASRYWVLGTGNWDASDTTHWSTGSGGGGGASVPGTSDDVFFDGASGGGTVTVTATQSVKSITEGAHTGTLNTSGQSITVSGTFSISGSATRTVTFGGSQIICGTWTATTTTVLTFNYNTSTIIQTGIDSADFNGGGKTYYIVQLTGSGNQRIDGANTFTTLTITGAANINEQITIAANQVISGTLTINGNSATNRILVSGNGSLKTLTAATVAVTYADFQLITGAGGGSWNLAGITGGSGNAGGCTGITFTTGVPQYLYTGVNSNWSDPTIWYLGSGGTGGAGRVPLPQDTATIDNASITAGGVTITFDYSRVGNMTWSGVTNSPVLYFSQTALRFNFFLGSIVLGSGMTITSVGSVQIPTIAPISSFTMTSNGVQWPCNLTFAGYGNTSAQTVTLGDDLSLVSTAKLNQTSSASAINITMNGHNIKTGLFTKYAGTLSMGSSTLEIIGVGTAWDNSSDSGTISGTGTVKFTNTTNSDITYNTYFGVSLYNLWFSRGASTGNIIKGSGAFTCTGYFKDDGSAAHTLQFTAASTLTCASFLVNGTSGHLITLQSSSTGTYSFTKTGGGKIYCSYLDIYHCVASPASTWYADQTCVNHQATATAGSGWIFYIAVPQTVDTLTCSESLVVAPLTIPGISIVDTVTCSENITTSEIAGDLTISSIVDTLTITENVTIFRYPLSLSSIIDTLSITESVTISEQLGALSSIVDTLSITESVTTSEQLGAISSVVDTLSITESVTIFRYPLFPSLITDTLSITESVTTSGQLGALSSIVDTLTCSESITVFTNKLYISSIVDTLTCSESVTVTPLAIPGLSSIVDTFTCSESVTVTPLSIKASSIVDTATCSESVTVTPLVIPGISVTDNLTCSENLGESELSNVNIFDQLSVTENVTTFSLFVFISVFDSLSITENLGSYELLNITIFETISITENLGEVEVQYISVFDTLSISENLIYEEYSDVFVFDSLLIIENVLSRLALNIDVFEILNCSENLGETEILQFNVIDVLTMIDKISLENFKFSPSIGTPSGKMRVLNSVAKLFTYK